MARSTVPQLSRPRAEPQRSGEALGASVMLWLIVIGLAVVAFYAL
jgi:multisubunit Na+/H+ antiporter MnhC subunit